MDKVDKTNRDGNSRIENDEDKDKVEHLLKHWIEHNEGHSESFRKWAGRIRNMEFMETADAIIQAANAMDESTVHLLEAQRLVDSSGK